MSRTRTLVIAALTVGVAAGLARLRRGRQPADSVILVTTTSTYDTGLLDALLPPFETDCGCHVKVLAVGTGQALAMGARGDADVALVHAPDLELKAVAAGDFVHRRPVMHSDFVVVGPAGDPAHVADAVSAVDAFRRIADAGAPFVSRGDASGTHHRELQIWSAAGLEPPRSPAYVEVGQGMAATLMVAAQRQAYTLSDRGTYLALRDRLDLQLLYAGDLLLLNPYHVLEVNPERTGRPAAAALARRLAGYLLSDTARDLIGSFGVARFGQPLFRPGPITPTSTGGSAPWN